MCIALSTWFRLSVQQVIDMYSQMITQGLLPLTPDPQILEESEHT